MTTITKLATAVVLGVALAGCASLPWAKPKAQMSCFWMKEDGSAWIQRDDVADKKQCFELDSCSGGMGMSGGGCYKWAKSKDAPGVKW